MDDPAGALARTLALCILAGACSSSPAEIDVRVPAGSVVLAGTLFVPSTPGPHPGVVIVHGSGSQTRDAYRPFANAFAQRGISALIYDKRGTGASTGDWQRSPFSALADDAQAAIDFVARRREIDSTRVGIWGGSEGGWIAPWVASRSPRVAFVIVQSAPVVNPARQHLYQVEQLVREAGGSPRDVETALDYVRMQHRFSASGEGWAEYDRQRQANRSGLLAMLGGPPTLDDWWWAWSRTRLTFDPPQAWAKVSAPVLAVWGSHDRNVPVEESRALLARTFLQSGNRSVTLTVLDADHDLMPGRAARASMLIGNLLRRTPGRTPAMDLMAEWAAERVGAKSAMEGVAPNDLDQAFEYDSGAALEVQVASEDKQKDFTVLDLTYASPLGGRVPAYVIVPGKPGKHPAVVFAHWMMDGSPLRNRREFLGEAKTLARAGVVSLLLDAPQVRKGFLPGTTELESLQRDADASRQLVVDVRRGIDLLLARYPVDSSRIAFVGHSFGAHVGGILSAVEKRIQSLVLMAGAFSDEEYVFDPGNPDMREFRQRVGDDTLRDFYDRTRWDDPIEFVGRSAPSAVFLQFGSNDDPIPVAKAQGYFRAFGEPKAVAFYEAGHALDARARIDRVTWLAHRLRLASIDSAGLGRIPPLK